MTPTYRRDVLNGLKELQDDLRDRIDGADEARGRDQQITFWIECINRGLEALERAP